MQTYGLLLESTRPDGDRGCRTIIPTNRIDNKGPLQASGRCDYRTDN